MDLLVLVFVVCVVAAGVMWILKEFAPPDPIRKLIIVGTVIVLALFIFSQLGLSIPNVLHR